MPTPSKTDQKGQVGQEHDGRPNSAHEQEVRKAGGSHESSETKEEEKSEK